MNSNINKTPLVSISCITYNHANYIRDAIEGFLMQKTNFSIEILIHDDASTDGTEEIIREYEAKFPNIIKPLYENENQWIRNRRGSSVFNFPRAKGKYIAMCEGDDYWNDSMKLQKQVDFLEANKDYSLCFHSAQVINEESKKVIYNQRSHWGNRTFSSATIIEGGGSFVPTASMIFPKSIIHDLPPVLSFDNKPVGDLFFAINCALNGKAYYIDQLMSTYRVHETNWSYNIGGASNSIKRYEHHLKIIEAVEKINTYTNFKYKKPIEKLISKEIKAILIEKKINKIDFKNEQQLYNQLDILDKVDLHFMKRIPKISWFYKKLRNFWKFIF